MNAPNHALIALAEIPPDLKEIPNWVTWKSVTRDGKTTKPPFIAGTSNHASSKDPNTWVNFETAATSVTVNGSEGIGFVIGGLAVEKNLIGVDLDGCRNPQTGVLTPWAEEIIAALDSYTEITPSETGVRVWIYGKLSGNEKVFNFGSSAGFGEKVKVEIYDRDRYFTVTGRLLNSFYGESKKIETRDLDEVYQLCREIRQQYPAETRAKVAEGTNSTATSSVQVHRTGTVLTDKLELLMHGTLEGDKPIVVSDNFGNSVTYDDRSAADLALCTLLAMKYGNDPDAIWKDYVASSLVRPKWENREADFRRLTIANGIKSAEAAKITVVSDAIQHNSEPIEAASQYDMTPEEIAAADEAEFPVYKLHEPVGPHFDESILYGVMGRAAKKICQYSEAHLGSVYLNLLVSFGNLIGRSAYFSIGETKHYTNENLACIGDSATARKGTGSDGAESLLRSVSSDFMNRCNTGGFGSPQGVIERIKDSSTFKRRDKKNDQYIEVVVPGVTDKRLCIRENELSNVFKLISDPKTRAGEVFRNLWDGKPISNNVAGKTDDGEHRSLSCREPHVSIVGYSTGPLTKATLPIGVSTSGDGNRFIWCYVKRTQLAPDGGPRMDWESESIEFKGEQMSLVSYLLEAVYEAKSARAIPLASAARKFWRCLYLRLENDKRAGFLGGMTSRGAAHIRRLAMIFCLIDREQVIQVSHLEAAEAIWNYSQESARYIFTGYSLEQEKILRLAHEKKTAGISPSREVHDLFNRHKSASWIKIQMDGLEESGHLTRTGDTYFFKKW